MQSQDTSCAKAIEYAHEKIEENKKLLDAHSKRIGALEQNGVRLEERISNLIKEIADLNQTLTWVARLLVGTITVYIIQNFIFK